MLGLKHARKTKGLSLAELAERTGIHPVSLARAERPEQDVKVSTVLAIAKALDVPVCELIDEGTHHAEHHKRRRPRRP